MITVTRIPDLAGLEAISDEWSNLADRAPDATPFQRPEWMTAWWQWFGSGDLHALAFRYRGRLVGFLPLFIHPWRDRRQVTLVGSGVSDCLGLLAEPHFAGDCAMHALQYLQERSDEWDICDWQDLSAGSPLIAHAADSCECSVAADTPRMRIDLHAGTGCFDAALSTELKRDLRRFTRQLERAGELRFETITDDVSLLGELFRLHVRRWSHKGGPASKVDRDDTQQFLCEVCRRFRDLGKLRLYILWSRGNVAAIVLALRDKGAVWDLITGMEPDLARYSPGSLLLQSAIGDAIQEGAAAWDFLRGAEPYKLRWGAKLIPAARLTIHSRAAADQDTSADPLIRCAS